VSARRIVRTVERLASQNYTDYAVLEVQEAPPGVREVLARALDDRSWFARTVQAAADEESGFARIARSVRGIPS